MSCLVDCVVIVIVAVVVLVALVALLGVLVVLWRYGVSADVDEPRGFPDRIPDCESSHDQLPRPSAVSAEDVPGLCESWA